jgi:hypothetical protein
MNDIISQENNEEFSTLFRLWEYFQENRDHTSDESRISMGNDCRQACNQPSSPTGGILETTELTPNETTIFTDDQFGTEQKNSLTATKMEMIMAVVVKRMLCSLRAEQAVRSFVL